MKILRIEQHNTYRRWALRHHRAQFPHYFVEALHNDTFSTRDEYNALWKPIVVWCEDQFGPPDYCWGALISWDLRNYVCFVNEIDAAAFKLRWC